MAERDFYGKYSTKNPDYPWSQAQVACVLSAARHLELTIESYNDSQETVVIRGVLRGNESFYEEAYKRLNNPQLVEESIAEQAQLNQLTSKVA